MIKHILEIVEKAIDSHNLILLNVSVHTRFDSYHQTSSFFIVQKQHKTHTVNSWVHWQTWKRHWGILAVQKHNVTEQTNKTRHSTIAMRQNLISDDFSLNLFLLANHANIPTYIGNLLMLWRLPYNIQQMSVLQKWVSPQFYCCTDAFSTFDLNSWCARIVIPLS